MTFHLPAFRFRFIILLSALISAVTITGIVEVHAQSVSVGEGSYSTSLPPGTVGPQNVDGVNISPKISSGFSQPVQTNDFWSSLIFPFFGDPHSNVMTAHPINAKAVSQGLQIGYPTDVTFAGSDYLYPYSPQLTVGVSGMSTGETLTDGYGDWTVTAKWEDGSRSMNATLGHGLPFVFFEVSGGQAVITPESGPDVWFNEGEVLGITIEGKHYGVFAPDGSEWSGQPPFTSSLNGEEYLSVALLPDNSEETLEYFRKHAYAFVTNSLISWNYDESASELRTTYTYETELREASNGNVNETLTALYRHQWKYAEQSLSEFRYTSPRGEMKLSEGNEFSTLLPFSGILPALPDQGDYNRQELRDMVEQTAGESLEAGDSYNNGKAMGRFAQLVNIADQLGAIEERDYFLDQLKNRLEDWLTAGGAQEYSYNDEWNVLTGYPSGFGADNQINDHHFHSSYAIRSAAIVAQFDPEWAAPENWGGMVNLLVKDSNNWERDDTMFPFLRSHDPYAGHSWAAGHGDFPDGNNQESSSESMNFASAVMLWGAVTQQDEVRDLGIFLHTNERTAIEQYWFDIDNAVYPETFPHVALGIVWGGKGSHATWFGADPEFIHGINILPINSGSLYLGRHPDYVLENYQEIVDERGSQPTIWKDVLWEYLALADPDQALAYYNSDPSYEPFDGESRGHTLHWLHNLKKMGVRDTLTFADTPTYSVFRNDADEKTYAAFNPSSSDKVVNFSDGYSLTVPAGEMHSESLVTDDGSPVVQLAADKTSGKPPLTVNFDGSRSFARSGGTLEFDWDFGGLASSSQPDTTYTFTDPGEYTVKLTVTDEQGIAASDSVQVNVSERGTPYEGTAAVVPGRVEAERYDEGGEGVAYHDREEENIGGAFRPDEGVDIEPSSGENFNVYWITAGEWIEYTIDVEESGSYTITPYVSTVPGFGNFRLYINNEDVSGQRNVLNTGGWQSWEPVTIEDVELEEGTQLMRIEFDSDSDPDGWLMSLDYFDFELNTGVSTEGPDERPAENSLEPNYPNPFNPTTTIRFSLETSSEVTLEVFDVSGRKVATLAERQTFSAGTHNAEFDAGSLSSGLYIYRLRTSEGFTQTRKMMLIK